MLDEWFVEVDRAAIAWAVRIVAVARISQPANHTASAPATPKYNILVHPPRRENPQQCLKLPQPVQHCVITTCITRILLKYYMKIFYT